MSYLEATQDAWLDMPASVRQHHSWTGGIAVHIYEVMSHALKLAEMHRCSETFTDELTYAAFVHDLDKVHLRYEVDSSRPSDPQVKKALNMGIPLHNYPGLTLNGMSKLIDAAVNNLPLPQPEDLPRHKYRESNPPMEDTGAVMWLINLYGLYSGFGLEFVSAVSTHHGGWSALAQSGQGRQPMTKMGVLLHAADLFSTQENGEEV